MKTKSQSRSGHPDNASDIYTSIFGMEPREGGARRRYSPGSPSNARTPSYSYCRVRCAVVGVRRKCIKLCGAKTPRQRRANAELRLESLLHRSRSTAKLPDKHTRSHSPLNLASKVTCSTSDPSNIHRTALYLSVQGTHGIPPPRPKIMKLAR